VGTLGAIVAFERKYTHSDGTIGTVAGSEVSAFAVAYFDDIAVVGCAFSTLYCTTKYPRMKTLQRLLLAGLENDFGE
jgi:hypothetical protein